MASANRERLLEKVDEKNCPGCRMDRAKEEQTGVPYKNLSYIWIVSLCTALPISSLFPFLYFMPAEKYPEIFAKSSIFGRFPFLLPCLLISIYAAGVFVSCWWLPETLHMHNERVSERFDPCDVLEASSNEISEVENVTDVDRRAPSKANLLRNWPLMSTIIVYCVFSLQEMAYTEIFSLWAVSNKKYGGLGFSSQDVGIVLAISGFKPYDRTLISCPEP